MQTHCRCALLAQIHGMLADIAAVYGSLHFRDVEMQPLREGERGGGSVFMGWAIRGPERIDAQKGKYV